MDQQDVKTYLEQAKTLGSRLGLERVSRLCSLLGDPQDSLPTVHVAGTNGKGSTASMIACALTAAGVRCGLYTSPYLNNPRESLRIGGAVIPQAEYDKVAALVAAQGRAMERSGDGPTAFELETAIAFLWFRQQGCAMAMIETGLGGRLDATNVIRRPAVSVITSISFDHVNILGDTLEKIAYEKCGILKPGGLAVSDPCQPEEALAVISRRAAEEGNRLILPDWSAVQVQDTGMWGSRFVYGGLPLAVKLPGRHQIRNAITAVEALRALGPACGIAITDSHIAAGLAAAAMPLRQEWVDGRPAMLLDGAHNLDKLTAFADTIKTHLAGRRVIAVMGMLKDKQYEPSVALIARLSSGFIACAPESDRALESQTTAAIARLHCTAVAVDDNVARAVALARDWAGADGVVVVCGSFYLAGPARAALRGIFFQDE